MQSVKRSTSVARTRLRGRRLPGRRGVRRRRPPDPPAAPEEDPDCPVRRPAAGGEDNTFDHPDTGADPVGDPRPAPPEGPPRYSAHVHSCMKMKYATIGRVLTVTRRQPRLDGRDLRRRSLHARAAGARRRDLRPAGRRGHRAHHRGRVEDARHLRERGPGDHRRDAEPCRVHGRRRRDSDVRCRQRVHRARHRLPHRLAGVAAQIELCSQIVLNASTPAKGKNMAVAVTTAAAQICE